MRFKISYLLVAAVTGLSFVMGSVLGGRESSAQTELQHKGIQLQRPGDSIEQQANLPPAKSALGVIGNLAFVVHKVEPDSPAAQLGLQKGDLITEWNGKQIISIKDFLAMGQLDPGQPIEIEFVRANFETGKYESLTGKTLLAPANYTSSK
jgi:serine protease Do